MGSGFIVDGINSRFAFLCSKGGECGPNQIFYNSTTSPCRTCADRSSTGPTLSTAAKVRCPAGCGCKPGLLLDVNNCCVPEGQCICSFYCVLDECAAHSFDFNYIFFRFIEIDKVARLMKFMMSVHLHVQPKIVVIQRLV